MKMRPTVIIWLALAVSLTCAAPLGFIKDLFGQFKSLEKQASPTAVFFTTTESTIHTAYKVTVTRINATWTRYLTTTTKAVVDSITSTLTVPRTAAILFFDGDSVGLSSLPPSCTSSRSAPTSVYTTSAYLSNPVSTTASSIPLSDSPIPVSQTTSVIPELLARQGTLITSSRTTTKMYLLINNSLVGLPPTAPCKTSINSASHDEYYKEFYQGERKAAEREAEEMKSIKQRKVCNKLKAIADNSSKMIDSRKYADARTTLRNAAKDALQVTKATFKHVIDRMRPWFGSNPHY